jgi:hypothetical protein
MSAVYGVTIMLRESGDAHVRTLPRPTFQDWVPPAVREVASYLYSKLAAEKDPTEALKIWSRLVSDLRMKRVWDEIYKKRRDINRLFVYPARLTNASNAAALREKARELRTKGGDKNREDAFLLGLEARLIELIPEKPIESKWSEQDLAAQSFFKQAYRIALTAPQLLSEIQPKIIKLREIADKLRTIATELQSIPIYVTEIYAEKLREVAADCEDDAKVMKNAATEPWTIARKRGNLRQRTFVTRLAHTTHLLFGNTLYGTIATVTNVVFGESQHKELLDYNVVAILYDNDPQIRPSLSPEIYWNLRADLGSC